MISIRDTVRKIHCQLLAMANPAMHYEVIQQLCKALDKQAALNCLLI